MARYGIDFYGTTTYGELSFVQFDATPFEGLPYGAGQNQLHWTIPSGPYSRLRLVRNAYGWPVQETDGHVLLDVNIGPSAVAPLDAPVSDYLDTDLQPGRLYYYTIFVLGYDDTNQHDEWRRAADTTCISVGKYDYTERMLNILPEAYWADPNDPSGRNDQLVRFLSIFGFQLDYIRSQYESLRYLHNPDKVAAALLAPLGDMFGIRYEPEIGTRQQRAMVRNATYINRRKGTLAGTNTLITSFTGWDAQITVGKNMMLDYNDASAEESVGRWRSETSTLSRRLSDGAVAAWQSSTFDNMQTAMLMLTSRVGGSGDLGFGPNHINAHVGAFAPIKAGIPVQAGQTYTFSVYAKAVTTGRDTSVAIRWCDALGKRISGPEGSRTTTSTTAWSRIAVSLTAPAGAVYAAPYLDIWDVPTTGGEQHVFDAMQFELGSSATEYQEPRDIRIVLYADRINELPNPSAEVGTTGWASTGATLTRDSTVAYSGIATSTAPTVNTGSPNVASFKLVATGNTSGNLHWQTGTSAVPVQGGEDYSLSAYYYGTVNSQLTLTFYDFGGNVLQTTTGQSRDWVNGAWIRPEVAATSPENAYYASATLSAEFTASGQAAWFDQVLLERSAEVRPYFDASQFGSHPEDNIWEGTAHASRSHYYFNRGTTQFRLDDLLNDYLLPGHTHTLLVAQPFQRATDLPSEEFSYGIGAFGGIPYI